MRLPSAAALSAPSGFAVLAAVLVGIGAIPANEAAWAVASAVAACAAGAWLAPGGWRRLLAQLTLLPVALTLTLVADPVARRMLVPALLVAAAAAAVWASLRRVGGRGWLVAGALALAVRCAGGLALTGLPWWQVGLLLVVPTAVAACAAVRHGALPGLTVALGLGAWPLETVHPGQLAGMALVLAAVLAMPHRLAARAARGWLPAALACSVVLASLAPWRGPPMWPVRPVVVAGAGAALLVTPWLPAAAAGAVWLGATLTLGPSRPPSPNQPGLELTAAAPRAALPSGTGGLYLVELALANAAEVPQNTVVGEIRSGTAVLPLRAGVEAAEWAYLRGDVFPHVGHTLPAETVFRPTGSGRDAVWGIAGQVRGGVWWGYTPVVERRADLPPGVVLSVATAGPVAPAPPRGWDRTHWLLAAAVVVALLQLLGGTWRRDDSWLPWVPLVVASLVARLPIEPLGRLGEEHAVDLALLAFLLAWAPLAAAWLRRGWIVPAAAALLVPLALASAELLPSGGDEPYHLIVLRSLSEDLDLDVANNYDLESFPGNRIYVTDHLLHSPALAALLLPGYALAGRTGALAELAALGVALLAALAVLWRRLGVPESRVGMAFFVVALSYPLITFSTQIWVEVVGALAAALAVVLASGARQRTGGVAAVAAVATVVKTRLGLIAFPVALVSAWPALRRGSARRRAAFLLLVSLAASVAAAWWFLGNPLGYGRRLSDLVPGDLRQPLLSLGGLIADPAGGLAFSAPLVLLALVGVPALWRKGGPPYRALLVGGGLTVLALLHSREWYGGGAPPARYLVPLLPIAALAGGMLLKRASAWRTLVPLAIPPTVVTSWIFVTRPHLSFNPGDGGWWLGDALARRFAADARHLTPSFLRPGMATWLVPVVAVVLASAVAALAHRRPRAARALGGATVGVVLVVAASFLVVLRVGRDRVVEVEDPQVVKLGGTLEPPIGTFSRYGFPNGWRLAAGEGVEIPLHLGQAPGVVLEGWLDGAARDGATLSVSWNGAFAGTVALRGAVPGRVALPPSPPGRVVLRLVADAPPGGTVVLDRVRVDR